jgi:hypothetical protein
MSLSGAAEATPKSLAKKTNRVKYYIHEPGKYQRLNPKNQTPARFVIGQRYKVGTGVILLNQNGDVQKEIVNAKWSYKRFLSYLLEEFDGEELLAFQWVPQRVSNSFKLSKINCGQPCVPSGGCIKPGCTCDETKGVCI